jgi:hypothetical protein
MNQVAQLAFIAAISDRALERRIDALAEQTACVIVTAPSRVKTDGDMQPLAANGAVGPLQWPGSCQARRTNRKTGYLQERRTTDTAISGKQREE